MSKRLPVDWKPSDYLIQWSLSEGYQEVEVLKETEAFIDYWLSTPGSKGNKEDWNATWRNWIRKSLGRRITKLEAEEKSGGKWRRILRPWIEAKSEYLNKYTSVDNEGRYHIDKKEAFRAYIRDVENMENGVSE